jgi:hypothetical protein
MIPIWRLAFEDGASVTSLDGAVGGPNPWWLAADHAALSRPVRLVVEWDGSVVLDTSSRAFFHHRSVTAIMNGPSSEWYIFGWKLSPDLFGLLRLASGFAPNFSVMPTLAVPAAFVVASPGDF